MPTDVKFQVSLLVRGYRVRLGGRSENEITANLAQLKLELGLSLAKTKKNKEYCSILQYRASSGSIRHEAAVLGGIGQYWGVSGSIRQYQVVSCSIGQYREVFSSIRPYPGVSGSIDQYLAVLGSSVCEGGGGPSQAVIFPTNSGTLFAGNAWSYKKSGCKSLLGTNTFFI